MKYVFSNSLIEVDKNQMVTVLVKSLYPQLLFIQQGVVVAHIKSDSQYSMEIHSSMMTVSSVFDIYRECQ